MNERIKAVRKHYRMNQTEFGVEIGLSQTTVASYENGKRDPLNVSIQAICTRFNVDEHWLRTGEGEMFKPQTEREEMHMLFAQFMAGDDDPDLQRFKEALFTVLLRTTRDEWRILEAKALEFIDLYQGKEEADQD
ncbi:MAG: helix-turn-helix transcriptional regulator [Ruminiclostridium sp.]|nr:helix-turn-helix transcriptional regulator [Ruminiclostridium sp.]